MRVPGTRPGDTAHRPSVRESGDAPWIPIYDRPRGIVPPWPSCGACRSWRSCGLLDRDAADPPGGSATPPGGKGSAEGAPPLRGPRGLPELVRGRRCAPAGRGGLSVRTRSSTGGGDRPASGSGRLHRAARGGSTQGRSREWVGHHPARGLHRLRVDVLGRTRNTSSGPSGRRLSAYVRFPNGVPEGYAPGIRVDAGPCASARSPAW